MHIQWIHKLALLNTDHHTHIHTPTCTHKHTSKTAYKHKTTRACTTQIHYATTHIVIISYIIYPRKTADMIQNRISKVIRTHSFIVSVRTRHRHTQTHTQTHTHQSEINNSWHRGLGLCLAHRGSVRWRYFWQRHRGPNKHYPRESWACDGDTNTPQGHTSLKTLKKTHLSK